MDVDPPENSGKHSEDQTNEQSNQQHDDQQISNYEKTKPFKLCVKVDKFPGLDAKKKILVQKFIVQQGIISFPIPPIFDKSKNLVIFYVRSRYEYEKLIDKIIKIDTTVKQDGTDEEITVTIEEKIFPYEETKKAPTDDEKLDSKQRTIQVVNIPLEIQSYQIRSVFSNFGIITKNGLKTRVRGMYQVAYITYEEEKSIQEFYNNYWSVYIGKHQVLVIPLMLSEEKREERNSRVIKLSALPFNTSAFDINAICEDLGVKYCFIPRNPNNNKPLKHAYLYFNDDELMEIAMDKNIVYEGQHLIWANADDKTCNRCGSCDHVAAQCDNEVKNRPKYMNRKEKLREFRNKRFNKKGNNPKSYADAAKSSQRNLHKGFNNTFRPWNQQNLGSHDQDARSFNSRKNMRVRMMANPYQDNWDQDGKLTMIQEQLNNLASNFEQLLNQQKTLKADWVAFKEKSKLDKQTQKPIVTNKNNNTQAVSTNNNGKRILIESTSSDSDTTDFEKRFNDQEQRTNQMAQSIGQALTLLKELTNQQKSQKPFNVIEGGDYFDEDDEVL
jgi:hypothetical protein